MRRALGFLIAAAVAVAAVWATARGPEGSPEAVVDAPTERRIFEELARREPGLRARSESQFPGDAWSQGDAFHAHELLLARRLARQHEVSVGAVLSIWDRGLREGWPGSERLRPSAPQCRPRPIY